MNKDEIIQWFTTFINSNKENFTLEWLRGQKLTFESICEMRKQPYYLLYPAKLN